MIKTDSVNRIDNLSPPQALEASQGTVSAGDIERADDAGNAPNPMQTLGNGTRNPASDAPGPGSPKTAPAETVIISPKE